MCNLIRRLRALATAVGERIHRNKSKDRFGKIANNYGELFTEVFEAEGLDYAEMERSVFVEASKITGFQDMAILDVGVGDGETSRAFIEAGCEFITGIDLNQEMLDQLAKKFGQTQDGFNKIRGVRADATDMSMFSAGRFPIIISGTCIHNIAKTDRARFWKEIQRLHPEVFIMVEKIANPDPKKHQEEMAKEIQALDEVYRKRHGLEEAARVWEEHYEYDERERLELSEIKEALGATYDITLIAEMGMTRTVRCDRRYTTI